MLDYRFNAKEALNELKNSLYRWAEENANGCNIVIGISGGKDSNICAALCCEVFGKDRVIGVRMPNGIQSDIDVAIDLCNTLGIKSYEINIKDMYDAEVNALKASGIEPSEQTLINIAPRLRMTTLYAVAQSHNGRVMNTSNLSEDWIGYATRWGDSVGDFMPFALLTMHEVKAIGYELGLPERFIEKKPSDGLVGVTDEKKFGFTYVDLDNYIREQSPERLVSKEVIDNITHKYQVNKFKLEEIPMYRPSIHVLYSYGDFDDVMPVTFDDDRNKFTVTKPRRIY